MVRAWFMDDDTVSDQRLDHHKCPQEFVDVSELYKLSGVEYFKFDPINYEKDVELTRIRKQRGYSYEDEINISKECLFDYDNKLKSFFTEHLHTDEEIRFVLDGSGFFDVRDSSNSWIRIEVVAGDMIVIPYGIYHRFTLDTKNYIKAKRYFVGEPVWMPYNRPADDLDCRKMYLQQLEKGFTTASVGN
ncbi:unnamed protein product [Diamesa serratosioi]